MLYLYKLLMFISNNLHHTLKLNKIYFLLKVDAQALFEKQQKLQEQIKDGEIDPNLYRGAAGYRQFIKPRVS